VPAAAVLEGNVQSVMVVLWHANLCRRKANGQRIPESIPCPVFRDLFVTPLKVLHVYFVPLRCFPRSFSYASTHTWGRALSVAGVKKAQKQ
jgi:hypothetical protein